RESIRDWCCLSSSQSLARPGTSGLALIQHQPAINDHVFDALAVAKGLIVGGMVDHTLRVEHGHVGTGARTQQAAVGQSQLGGAERSHLADGILQPQHASLPDVYPQLTREGAEVPRMRMA